MSESLHLETTPIPGLLVARLPLHRDARGWFKENWQRAKMTALGMPDFGPVQNNISFNATTGVTRGIHAEPWDKLVSVAFGRVFAAWVDLRAGETFGVTHHVEIDPAVAVFVPRGVGNSYQTLEDRTAYSYLVNEHWRPAGDYPALHPADETAGIPWPVPLERAEISEKDRRNPRLDQVIPVPPRRTLVIGAGGQLGRALREVFPEADLADAAASEDGPVHPLDLTDPSQVATWPWAEYDLVLNAAAYTAVDAAETPEGRRAAWTVNATAPGRLAALAREHRFTLVHYSTDYVFDGTREAHAEDEPFAPLGVYGQSKAAGDLAVSAAPRHYLLRTSWVVGEGHNFVATMARLADDGVSPRVVEDQVGRLTFTTELARATRHLVRSGAAHGTYHCTNAGPPTSWADIARHVFALRGRDPGDVASVTTVEYAAGSATAPRPANSVLALERLAATGFTCREAGECLEEHLGRHHPQRRET